MTARYSLLLLAAVASLVPGESVLAQSSPSEPFAVTSRGRPAPRTERSVVVLRDSVAPRPAAPDTTAARRAQAAAAATRAADTASARARASTTATGRPAAETAAGANRSASATNRAAADSAAARPRTAPARPAPAASSSVRTHTIAWGDTWYSIARQYGVTQAELRAANPDVDPNKIVSGQEVRVPSAAASRPAEAGASRVAAATTRAVRRTHRVEPGESLWGIARRYGVSMDAVREANDIEDDRVRIGATLVIPAEER